MSIKAMKLALEALELVPYMSNKDDHDYYAKAINTLRRKDNNEHTTT